MATKENAKIEKVEIPAPKFRIAEINIVGAAPLVINKFSRKAREQIIATQKEGSRATGKKKREPKNFDEVYSGAMHLTHEGWSGVPAGAFRNAMISALWFKSDSITLGGGRASASRARASPSIPIRTPAAR